MLECLMALIIIYTWTYSSLRPRRQWLTGLSLTVIIASRVNFLFIQIKKKLMVRSTSFYNTVLLLLTNLFCFRILLAFWNVDESQYFHHYSLNNFSVCVRVCLIFLFASILLVWKKIPYKWSAESFAFVLVWSFLKDTEIDSEG